MAEEKQEGQKTVVSFIVGLLVGGLLVWAFSSPTPTPAPKDTDTTPATDNTDVNGDDEAGDEEPVTNPSTTERPALPVGDGRVTVNNQPAGSRVALAAAVFPVAEGWIGVRDYQAGQLRGLLGVVRFSEEQGLVPTEIVLQRPTTSGNDYAVVVYSDNGDRQFNLADDVQIDTVFATFTAQ